MVRVLHSSDLHGKYKRLLEHHRDTEFDVWLDTGDFFDNAGRRKGGGRIEADVERRYHAKWLVSYTDLPRRLTAWLRGRPALIVPGNHDFISLEKYLQFAGANAERVTTAGVQCCGLKWAGFREIPYISGEWMGEEVVFGPLIESTLAADPDILVTHGPPGGILDEVAGYGNSALTTALAYRSHRIRTHFFGHAHVCGGRTEGQLGIRFVNGACNAILHALAPTEAAR